MTHTRLKKEILSYSENILNEVITIRRHLHQYPELSFKEYNTSKYIQEQLKKIKVPLNKLQTQVHPRHNRKPIGKKMHSHSCGHRRPAHSGKK
ncbi:MAG: hypothetical protein KatS3mg028_0852 [Bacteroidia bacterium]|nr:MAG: hypothetical protein KatS3mg028_0852 [Bacteroidia bacterium]